MFKRLVLSFVCGLILFLSWPPITTLTFLIFFSLVPLLIIERDVKKKDISTVQYFFYCYLAFFIFNTTTTFWINYAHFGGAVFAILCNSFFMAFVLYLYAVVKNRIQWKNTFFLLPIFWISFEYLHLNWDLSWPWLTLGNVFSSQTDWVQWYKYTGVLGGSLWVVLINLFIVRYDKLKPKYLIYLFIFILAPIITSKYIYKIDYNKLKSINNNINVLVVQPNIDPYADKFSLSQQQQTNSMLDLVQPHIDSSLQYLILPETFLSQPIWKDQIAYNLDIKKLKKLIEQSTKKKDLEKSFSSLNIIVGATILDLSKKSPRSKSLNTHNDHNYQVYNTALHLKNNFDRYKKSNNVDINYYHKSKLVPGAEKMPFQKYIYPILGDKILQIGSSTSLGNFSSQDSVSVFNSSSSGKLISIAPIICYESIYGDYVREFVKKGAMALCVITNDGWWKQTSGYKQHSMYAKLRAVETRRYITRSANTGVSSIINPFGQIEKQLEWDKRDVIKSDILLINNLTFYVKYGDYIGRISSFLSVLIMLYFLVFNKLEKSYK